MNNRSCSQFLLSPPSVRAFGLLGFIVAGSIGGGLPSHAAQLAPKVALIQPAQGERFINPAEILITALAEDADGYVQAVELFSELGSLGLVTPNPASASPLNPFHWTWKNPPPGDHKLAAQATDNDGLSSFSESVVISVRRDSPVSPATLTFIKPEDGAVVTWPGPVSIDLVAVDPDGDIRHVEFLANGTVIGRSDHWTKDAVIPGRPREHFFEWTPAVPAFYRLIARAADTQGNPVESKPIAVTVGSDLPVVSIESTIWETTEPAPHIRVRPAVCTLRRTGPATDPLTVFLRYEGSATADADYQALPEQVTFLSGETEKPLLIEPIEDSVTEGLETVVVIVFEPVLDRLPEYIVDPLNAAAKIVIHDSFNPSSAIVEITAPKDGQAFAVGEPVEIHATAIDPKGYIARVEFFDFEKQIGVSQIEFFRAPDPGTPIYHTFEWREALPGDHVLTARAIDSHGNRVVSKPVRVQVGPVNGLPIVEVTALDSEATEFPPFVDAIDPARFVITRRGDLTQDLYVVFSLHGTADRGKDYTDPGRLVRMAAGQAEAVIEIMPLSDELDEPIETVALRLEDPMPISSLPVPPTPYQMTESTCTAAAVIFDRTRPEQGALEFVLPGSGSVFRQFEPIRLLIAGYHPTFDVSHVDFYSDETLIGSSDIVFDKVAPGGLIFHEFDWKDPIPGDHVLTARSPRPDGTMLLSGKVQIHVQGSVQPAVVLEIDSDDTEASEATADGAPDPAVFHIRRVAGPRDVAVTVYYQVDGTAQNGIDYEPLDGKIALPAGEDSVALVVKPIPDRTVEGDETVVVSLAPTPCPAIYPPPPWCYQIGTRSTVRAVIRDAGSPPLSSVAVRLLSPQPGAVFTAGETVPFKAVAFSPSAPVSRLEIWLDDHLLESTELSELSITRTDVAPGPHVVEARALDKAGVVGRSVPVKILVREVDAVAFVRRVLPAGYIPGETFTVSLMATPPSGTSAYAVEDQPPVGWQVGSISSDGVFDSATGRVKFGLFTDDTARRFTYTVTPPSNATGPHRFSGSSAANGKVFPIAGDTAVFPAGEAHPADLNPEDYAISLAELTAYGAAWKKGESWSVGPVPIPLPYVTQAGLIWQRGEKYRYDLSAGAAPACWASTAPMALSWPISTGASYAERQVVEPAQPGQPYSVQIQVQPIGPVSAYAVQEHVPVGWTISEISQDGFFDPKANCIRWGIFLDSSPRLLGYRALPSASSVGAPRGVVSFDGNLGEIRGINSGKAFEAAGAIVQFRRIERGPAGAVRFRVAGPVDRVCTLETSTDLIHWTELMPVLLPDGEIEFHDEVDPTQARRFYRAR